MRARKFTLAAAGAGRRVAGSELLVEKLFLRQGRAVRMARRLVAEIRRVIRCADDAPDYRVDPLEQWRPSGDCECRHCLALLPLGPMVVSHSLKMRLYSSVQLAGRVKPWFSTGYDARSQFVLPSSISRSSSRTIS